MAPLLTQIPHTAVYLRRRQPPVGSSMSALHTAAQAIRPATVMYSS